MPHALDIIEWYDTLSGVYDELYGEEQIPKLYSVIEFLEELGVEGIKILDAGCGTALLAALIPSRIVKYYVCFDISYGMLSIGKKRTGLKNFLTDLVAGDIEHLPFRGGFDVAVAVSVVRCGEEGFIDSLRQVIQRNGHVVYTVICGSGKAKCITSNGKEIRRGEIACVEGGGLEG